MATCSSTRSRRNEKRSWRAPITMIVALLSGLGLALAQHSMYAVLDGRPIEDVYVSQAWISRIGTALAFAVKTVLVISVACAFVQYQWLRLQQSPWQMSQIDTITGIMGNILSFFESTVWLRNPVLALLAIIAWTIPLSAVIVPGSLLIEPRPNVTVVMAQVPQADYTNGDLYGKFAFYGGYLGVYPNKALQRIMAYTATSSDSVNLPFKHQNESYSLQFDGPALKCASASDALIFNMSTYKDARSSVGFSSWVPDNSRYTQGDGYALDVTSYDAARLFVKTEMGDWAGAPKNSTNAVFRTALNYTYGSYKVNISECLLWNASYRVDFAFRFPNQTRSIRIDDWHNPVPVIFNNSGRPAYSTQTGVKAYAAIMASFGKLLVGNATSNDVGVVTTFRTSWEIVNIEWERAEMVRSGLEQLFQNFTLSLLSDTTLIQNSSVAQHVPVTIDAWPNTYVYQRADLLLAYGFSLLATIICVMIGMSAFLANHASYQNVFSTYLRAAHGSEIDQFILNGDCGAAPLPDDLSRARVCLGAAGRKCDGSIEYASIHGRPTIVR